MRNSWALLFGMHMLMVGNGLQGTVLGVRGEAEGFSGAVLGIVMSAYFIGFLGGTQATPYLLRKVGHVRVFAALASFVSAAFILFAALVDPVAWFLLRVVVGFCFSGIYVVAESWLNDSATNETRGQTMSAYITAQMSGIVLAQALLNFADPGGYTLFVIMSVLVSVSFAPILLSSSPVPMFEATRRMGLRALIEASPLGCFAMFMLGVIFACQFGMGAVYAAGQGLTNFQISLFIGTIYVGAVICQPPIGWISDRMDRRRLISVLCLTGSGACLIVPVTGGSFTALMMAAFVMGATSNPLYSLILAYVNDYLEPADMASASAGLIFINGVGAMGAPFLVGYLMDEVGGDAFFFMIGASFAAITGYAFYRMTQRAATPVDETGPWVYATPVSSQVSVDAAWEAAIEQVETDAETELSENREAVPM
ncbi:MAG: MFS transporter [Paracoccaceae bacterium]